MKQILLLTMILTIVVSALNAQSIFGKWRTIDHETGKVKSVVEIYKKEGKVYGKVVEILSKPNSENLKCDDCPQPWTDKPILGLDIIRGLEKDDDGWYADDAVIDPERKKVYDCRIWREGDKLMVRGFLGWFYSTQEWLPVK